MFYNTTPEETYHPSRHQYYSHSSKYYRDDSHSSYSPSSSSSTPRAHGYSHSPIRRSRTVGPPYVPSYEYDSSDTDPHVRLPHTYAWALEQQIADMVKANDETVHWVHEQQSRDSVREQLTLRVLAARRRGYPTSEDRFRPEAQRHATAAWAEGEKRWKRWEHEAEYTIQEELRRLQAYRRETERHRLAYERRKRLEEERERETMRSRKQAADRQAADRYEAQWEGLLSSESNEMLGFSNIAWPMFSRPRSVHDITPARIAKFVLSPLHPGETRREKIRNALKRWHPDRFGRLWARMRDDEKEMIEEGVGVVARCLNDLLEKQSQ